MMNIDSDCVTLVTGYKFGVTLMEPETLYFSFKVFNVMVYQKLLELYFHADLGRLILV